MNQLLHLYRISVLLGSTIIINSLSLQCTRYRAWSFRTMYQTWRTLRLINKLWKLLQHILKNMKSRQWQRLLKELKQSKIWLTKKRDASTCYTLCMKVYKWHWDVKARKISKSLVSLLLFTKAWNCLSEISSSKLEPFNMYPSPQSHALFSMGMFHANCIS